MAWPFHFPLDLERSETVESVLRRGLHHSALLNDCAELPKGKDGLPTWVEPLKDPSIKRAMMGVRASTNSASRRRMR